MRLFAQRFILLFALGVARVLCGIFVRRLHDYPDSGMRIVCGEGGALTMFVRMKCAFLNFAVAGRGRAALHCAALECGLGDSFKGRIGLSR
jgi:hypothetical protein